MEARGLANREIKSHVLVVTAVTAVIAVEIAFSPDDVHRKHHVTKRDDDAMNSCYSTTSKTPQIVPHSHYYYFEATTWIETV